VNTCPSITKRVPSAISSTADSSRFDVTRMLPAARSRRDPDRVAGGARSQRTHGEHEERQVA
jgi:hypothetical protein